MKCPLVFFVFFLFIFFSGCIGPFSDSGNPPSSPMVCFSQSDCVNVEVADSPEQRAQGLMFRSTLDQNAGMLFVFEESSLHGFWMKNTLIPLDMIWVDSTFEIVDIQSAVPCARDPCQLYVPREDARYVIEVNSGFAARNGIMVGDSVQFRIPI